MIKEIKSQIGQLENRNADLQKEIDANKKYIKVLNKTLKDLASLDGKAEDVPQQVNAPAAENA